MKYFIVSGEASGDLHGANMIKALKKIQPDAEFVGWGGDLMQKEGLRLTKHYKELAFMGFWEVLKNIRTIFKNIRLCKTQIQEEEPDAVIFIDYPGFNLRMTKFAHKQGYKTLYYISPTVWAWKESRIKTIKKYVDRLFVILPFEQQFYAERDCEVEFVGHPLIDAIEDFKQTKAISSQEFKSKYGLSEQPIVALLPGSRKQEINKKLPLMLEVAKKHPDYQFIVAGAPGLEKSYYEEVLQGNSIKIIYNDTYNLLNNAYAGLITSGTATLEAALFNVPQVVVYQAGKISYSIAKRLVTIKYISLVNLILDKEVVTELIQNDLTVENLEKEFEKIIDKPNREKMQNDYKQLKELCGGVGASDNIARGIVKIVEEK